MSDYISPILQWINAHPHLAGLATFLISAAESIAIIGTLVPGTVMMTAIGTLAGAGVMPLWSTVFWAILGAIFGDGISYWIGYYFKDRLREMWPFRNYPTILESGIKFFHKHGGKSVFIGRFVGPVRALVPLVAGMLHMKPWRFMLANITSAIGWAPAYMLPGIALGAASLELPPDMAVHALLMVLLASLFIIFCLWIIRKLFLLINKQINYALTKSWQRLHSSRHFSLITTALQHHHPRKTHGQLTLAFYLIITVISFFYLAGYVYSHGSQTIFVNNFFYHLFRSIRTPTLDDVMIFISFLGDAKTILPSMVALFIWFLFTKRLRTALHILILGILTVISVELFKHLTHAIRPWGILLSPKGSSFPSGHATFAMTYFMGIALILIKIYKQEFRLLFYRSAGIIIFAICLSRIYLGAHWFTDIIGGLLLGSIILMIIVLSYNRQAEKIINPFGVISIIFLSLFLSYGVNVKHNYSELKQNSAIIDWPIYSISLDTWWKEQTRDVLIYRLNRFGLSTQILNLQWLDNLENIKQILLQNGWQIPPQRNWISVLHRLSDVQSAEHLPLVSPLYLDKNPVLTLIKHASGNKKLIVLRLWDSRTTINNIQLPLWVGTVELAPRTYSWLFRGTRANEINLSPALLFMKLPATYDIKQITVRNIHRRKKETQTMILIKPKNIVIIHSVPLSRTLP